VHLQQGLFLENLCICMENNLQVMVRVQKDFSACLQVWCYAIAEFLMSVASEVRPYVAINAFTVETLYTRYGCNFIHCWKFAPFAGTSGIPSWASVVFESTDCSEFSPLVETFPFPVKSFRYIRMRNRKKQQAYLRGQYKEHLQEKEIRYRNRRFCKRANFNP